MRVLQRHYFRFFLISIVSVAAIGSSGCKPSKYSLDRPDMTPLSHRLLPIFEQTKTICFGRFVIDVPATAIIVFGPTEAETRIEFHPGKAGDIARLVAQQLTLVESDRRFLTEKDQVRLPMFGKVIDGAAPGQKLVFGSKDQAGYSMYSFFPVGEHLYVHELSGGVSDEAGVDNAKRFFNEIATTLRPRTNDEVPADKGMCIEGGFIPLDMKYEKATLGIRFKEFPDVHFSVEAHKNQEYVPESADLETLLERAEKNAMSTGLAGVFAKIKTFRRGKRDLGVWSGFEILARKPHFKNDTDAHEFRFRSVGAVDDAYHPELDVQLDTGVKNNTRAAIKPSITDEEAIALWDKLISSIRVRSATDSRSIKATSQATLGSVVATAEPCPESGWWQCDERGVLQSDRRKHVVAGDPMPYTTVLGHQTLWQKLSGEHPKYRAATKWKLVEYDAAPLPTENDHA